ncbi:MAG TPA: type II secretion system protein [Vicinamibacterales bacterium]
MRLAGQGHRSIRATREHGYAMAALLVAMSIAAIMMTVVMPVWKQMAQREKEEELVFRGQQYVRALRLFSMKYANASPPTLDVLVEQRFIRKKFKDPITNDDFQPILAGQPLPGTAQAQGASQGRGASSTSSGSSQGTPASPGGTSPTTSPMTSSTASPFGRGVSISSGSGTQPAAGQGRGVSPIGTPGAGSVGGIIGVVSKSTDKSLRVYNGRTHYNEWAFINTPQTQAPGAGAPGTAAPGQRGRQGQSPDQPNPFGNGIGGQRGRENNPGGPGGGRGFGPGQPPSSPFQPVQPIQPGRGRSGF